MNKEQQYDVIIVGGSYSGLAAGMALGRALRRVLIIDRGNPCNRQTPLSHNFITQDGVPPLDIAANARRQVAQYATVAFMDGLVTAARPVAQGFEVRTDGGSTLNARKLVFATGVRDIMPGLKGFAECWGISVLHCPYCHGYEVRHQPTGVLGNGDRGYELVRMISHWTKELTLYTDGPSTLSAEQTMKLHAHRIGIVETPLQELVHREGYLEHIHLADGFSAAVKALYAQPAFEQHSLIPQQIGCAMTEDGYIKVDPQQQTSVPGLYACGDNTTRLRTVANAVAQGTAAGMMLNKEIITEEFG